MILGYKEPKEVLMFLLCRIHVGKQHTHFKSTANGVWYPITLGVLEEIQAGRVKDPTTAICDECIEEMRREVDLSQRRGKFLFRNPISGEMVEDEGIGT